MRRSYKRHIFDRNILEQSEQLSRLDNWHAPVAVILDYAVIMASIIATLYVGWIIYPLAVLIIGSRQRALATILHEAAHNTLTSNKRFSQILATFFSGYLIFSIFSVYKASHVKYHHGQFGNVELDPDYKYMIGKGIYRIKDEKRLIGDAIIKPLLLWSMPSFLFYLIKARTFGAKIPKERLEHGILCTYWAILLIGFYFSGNLLNLFLFWIIPFFTTFQIIGWFIELAEHGPLMENKLDLHMTRNRHSHWLEKFLTGMHGESYHLVHHLRPRIPFWQVAACHKILLQDAEYKKWDSQCGGIFMSSNGAPSVISLLIQQCRQRKMFESSQNLVK